MGADISPSVDINTVDIRATSKRIIFRGVCNQKFNVTLDDWEAIKKRVRLEIRAAKKRIEEFKVINQTIVDNGSIMPR